MLINPAWSSLCPAQLDPPWINWQHSTGRSHCLASLCTLGPQQGCGEETGSQCKPHCYCLASLCTLGPQQGCGEETGSQCKPHCCWPTPSFSQANISQTILQVQVAADWAVKCELELERRGGYPLLGLQQGVTGVPCRVAALGGGKRAERERERESSPSHSA